MGVNGRQGGGGAAVDATIHRQGEEGRWKETSSSTVLKRETSETFGGVNV